MDNKRKCIFTNQSADAKLTISSSRHNWAKSVPCTKEFLKSKNSNELTSLEFKLVKLFFQKELSYLKIENLDAQMSKIREKIKIEPLTDEDIEWLEADLGEWDVQDKEENCPKCTTLMINAPKCTTLMIKAPIGDGPELYKRENKLLTPEENYDRVNKVVKKKDNLWE